MMLTIAPSRPSGRRFARAPASTEGARRLIENCLFQLGTSRLRRSSGQEAGGVVDQQGDGPERGFRRREQRIDLGGIGEIGR